MKLLRAIVIFVLSDIIVSDSGYNVPPDMARFWAEEILRRVKWP